MKPRVDSAAPSELTDLTHEVRNLIVENFDAVAGFCVEAAMVLGRALLARGLPAEMRSCRAHGDWHWRVHSGDWILDPTSGQWGDDPVLIYRRGSDDDWYEPGQARVADLTDDEDIIWRFAVWGSPESTEQLLRFAGASRLAGAVEDARVRLAAERAELWRDG